MRSIIWGTHNDCESLTLHRRPCGLVAYPYKQRFLWGYHDGTKIELVEGITKRTLTCTIIIYFNWMFAENSMMNINFFYIQFLSHFNTILSLFMNTYNTDSIISERLINKCFA